MSGYVPVNFAFALILLFSFQCHKNQHNNIHIVFGLVTNHGASISFFVSREYGYGMIEFYLNLLFQIVFVLEGHFINILNVKLAIAITVLNYRGM